MLGSGVGFVLEEVPGEFVGLIEDGDWWSYRRDVDGLVLVVGTPVPYVARHGAPGALVAVLPEFTGELGGVAAAFAPAALQEGQVLVKW